MEATLPLYHSEIQALLQRLDEEGMLYNLNLYSRIYQVASQSKARKDLRFRLAALIVKDAAQQERFYDLFDEIFGKEIEEDILKPIAIQQTEEVIDIITPPAIDPIEEKQKLRELDKVKRLKQNSRTLLFSVLYMFLVLLFILSGNFPLSDKSKFPILVIMLIVVSVVNYIIRKRNRGQQKSPILQLDGTDQSPTQFHTLHLPDYQLIKFDRPFKQLATQLRRRRISETPVLNVKQTVLESIRRGGFLKPVYSFRTQPPAYLLLIDNTKAANHRTRLYDTLYHWLKEEQVSVTRFYYRNDPRYCWNDAHPDGLSLNRLAEIYSSERLLIFGDGWQFLHPTEAGLAEWAKVFDRWLDKAILSPINPRQWTQRELYLERNFVLAPASNEGLRYISEQFEREEGESPLADQWVGEPSIEVRATHLEEDLRALIPDPELREWLAALSCFPKLNWKLTLYLGTVLEQYSGGHLLTFDNLRKLSRLSWFYNGYFPADIRSGLYESLEEEQRKHIHDQIYQWLLKEAKSGNPELGSEDVQQLQIALQKMAAGKSSAQESKALREELITKQYLRVVHTNTQEDYDTVVPPEMVKLFPGLKREVSRNNRLENWQNWWQRILQFFNNPQLGQFLVSGFRSQSKKSEEEKAIADLAANSDKENQIEINYYLMKEKLLEEDLTEGLAYWRLLREKNVGLEPAKDLWFEMLMARYEQFLTHRKGGVFSTKADQEINHSFQEEILRKLNPLIISVTQSTVTKKDIEQASAFPDLLKVVENIQASPANQEEDIDYLNNLLSNFWDLQTFWDKDEITAKDYYQQLAELANKVADRLYPVKDVESAAEKAPYYEAGKLKVFILYASADIAYVDTLLKHLSPMNNQISICHDRLIDRGEVETALVQADIVLFLASEKSRKASYVTGILIPAINKRIATGDCTLIPIQIDIYTLWEFEFLDYKSTLAYPIIDPRWKKEEEAWIEVVKSIRELMEEKTSPVDIDRDNPVEFQQSQSATPQKGVQQIRDYLANAKVDQALKALVEIPVVKENEDFSSIAVLLDGRYRSNERARIQGVIDNSSYMAEHNRINHSILSLLQEIEERESISTSVGANVKNESANETQKQALITEILNIASVLVRKNELKNALQLLSILIDTSELQYSLLINQGQLQRLEKGRDMGIITEADFQLEKAKTTKSTLDIINNLQTANKNSTLPTIIYENAQKIDLPLNKSSKIQEQQQKIQQQHETATTNILMLVANPFDSAKRQLNLEHSRVTERLQETQHPENYSIRAYRTLTPSVFTEHIYSKKPSIVHFAGHGDKENPELQQMMRSSMGSLGERAKRADESGVFLLDKDRQNAAFVSPGLLENIFKTAIERHDAPIEVVLFNGCYSKAQAEAVAAIVPYVIGTSWEITDEASLAFATRFYFGISQEMKVEAAADFAKTAVLAYNEPEERFFFYKDGKRVDW